jgi:molecular chaperone GrpE
MEAHEIEAILDRFRDWLSQTQAEQRACEASGLEAPATPGPSVAPPEVGLLQLAEAFTALRHELKLQTKSARNVEESVQTALGGLDRAIAHFQTVQAREVQAAEQAGKPLVAALIELDEALERGVKAVAVMERRFVQQSPQQLLETLDARFARLPAWRRWFAARWHLDVRQLCQDQEAETLVRAFSALAEGYQLVQSRLHRVLAEQQIERIECVGRHVDPTAMTVVELVDDPRAPPETVVDELRPGYTWRGQVVRYAEVRAVRPRPMDSPSADSPSWPGVSVLSEEETGELTHHNEV